MTAATYADTVRNGMVSMPIRTVEIKLDEAGYPGWSVTMRTNPRSSVYDELISGDPERWWKALGRVVLEWNFADEDGARLPLPREVESEQALDLPVLLLSTVLDRYFESVRAAAALPKALSASSAPISSTSVGDQSTA